MRAALHRGDAPGLTESAHRFRGMSATLGAQRVARLCADIEARSRAGDLDELDTLLQELAGEVRLFQASMASILGSPEPAQQLSMTAIDKPGQ